ncbi:MAG: HAD-IIIC family phosphatase [Rhodanobacter sp.]|jgi:FkbH-like protein|nr:HAD-IIIC family phosphatase [Rhodanobacter sp.]
MAEHEQGAVAVAATFTAEPLRSNLDYLFEKAGFPLTVKFAPYHQVIQELLSPSSVLAGNAKGANVVLVRLEDFVRDRQPTPGDSSSGEADFIAATACQLADALMSFSARAKSPTIVGVLAASRPDSAVSDVIEAENARLIALARKLSGVLVLTQDDVDLLATTERYDDESDALAHIPFTEEYFAAIAIAVARKVHAALVPARKVLVLDCDNTLWQGVVGEDGVEGIRVTPSCLALQQFAVEAQKQGALICLASKNTEQDVIRVFEMRDDMRLKLDHIVAHRINWNNKPENVRSLARALNLGLDSFVFIDDNPVECELMRAELPQVLTVLLPADGEVAGFLARFWAFDKPAVTNEDKRRTDLYKEDIARKELESNALDIVEFIASLNVVVDIGPPDESEWPRLAQLTQRTNQFNFSTVRRTESELRNLAKEASILRVRVKDRFGDYGLVGLVIHVVEDPVLVADTFLLSCRVLGRGVEHTILRELGAVAEKRGLSHVVVPFVASDRNEPARAFIDSVAAQFRQIDNGRETYRIPAADALNIHHRPGHDPDEVIKARDAEGNKPAKPAAGAASGDHLVWLAGSLRGGEDLRQAVAALRSRPRSLPGESVAPAGEHETRMLALWREVLGVPDLGVEDDFAASGGSSLLAARLFALAERQFGVKLPLTSILDHCTARQLVRFMDARGPSSASMVTLRPGGTENFYFVHDGDGETLLYQNIARRLPDAFTVIGIEPRRLQGIPLAHTRIEDMAAYYVHLIRDRQPSGPYYLGGMCAGGVIAFEVARQLEQAGSRVELVALLDAASPTATERPGRISKQRLQRLAQVAQDRRGGLAAYAGMAATFGRKAFRAARWEVSNTTRRAFVCWRFKLLDRTLRRNGAWPAAVPSLSVREIYDTAESGYRPTPISGPNVLLIRACSGEGGDTPFREIFAEDALGWAGLTDHLDSVDVDGGHFSMLQEPFAQAVAAQISARIRTPQAREPDVRMKIHA